MRQVFKGIGLTAAGICAATGALAQSTGDESVSLDEVTVTGSRIERSGFTAPTPTQVLDSKLLEQRATVNVGDLLNEVPAFRGTNTPAAGGIGNPGIVLADLRGLTATRTLVLLERNRLPATTISGGGSAGATDLGAIPTALISNIEVVTGGASAAYGSDAIAGVVNVQLNDRLQGIKANVQYGETRYGDAQDTFASLAGGISFASGRGHAIAGIDYNNNDGTGEFNDERGWGRRNFANTSFPNRPVGTPANVIAPNTLFGNATSGGLIRTNGPLLGLAFVPTANGGVTTTPFTRGLYGNLATSFDAFSDAAAAANAAAGIFQTNYQQLRPEIRRVNALAKVSFDLTDNLSAFIEPMYSHTRAEGIILARRDGAGAGPALTLAASNYYLSQALTPAQLAQVPTAGLSVAYFGSDFGPSVSTTSKDLLRLVTGLKGNFGDSWKWDVTAQHGRNVSDRAISNTFNNTNFRNAIDVVLVSGAPACRSATARAAGCEPINLLGRLNASTGARAYVLGTATGRATTVLQEISSNLQGEPFSNWAGPVSVGVGVERRWESLSINTDALSRSNTWLTGAGTALAKVTQNATEGYLETVVPLAKDLPLARAVDLNAAVRFTDYSTSGSVTTWKGGLTWEALQGLRFRTTLSRDIRAPNLIELYTPVAPSLPLPLDPRPGVPPITNTAGVTTGGNPALEPEKADTFTIGTVIQPAMIDGLRFSLDYYRIEIKGAITSTAPQAIVNNCLPGGVYSGNEYCSLISFANNDTRLGQITRVQGTTANVATFRTRGLDVQATYNRALPVGQLTLNLGATRAFEYWTSTDVSALFPNGINRAGQTGAGFGGPAGLPSWLFNLYANYRLERLSVNAQVRHLTENHQNKGFIGPDWAGYSPTLVNSINDNIVPSRTYVNLGASYNFGNSDRREVYFNVDNVFDRDPPAPANNNAYYDLMGRTWRVGLRYSFQ
jgi:iron complex outermembrane recepter protein